MKLKLSILCLLVCGMIIGISARSVKQPLPWIPRAADDDIVDVYLMEGVMSQFIKWEKLFKPFHVYHAAIGTRNRNSGHNATFEYYPPAFQDAIFPRIKNPGPSCSIDFVNKAIVSVEGSINDTLFNAGGELLVSTISGKLFNQFLDWTPSYNETADLNRYYLWTVESENHGSVWLPQHEVDPTDPAIKAQLCKFFDVFRVSGESIFIELAEILHSFEGPKFAYAWGKYYLMDFKWPYVGYHYDVEPLPGQP